MNWRGLHLRNAELGVDRCVHAEEAAVHPASFRVRCIGSGLRPSVRAVRRMLRGCGLAMVVQYRKCGGHNDA